MYVIELVHKEEFDTKEKAEQAFRELLREGALDEYDKIVMYEIEVSETVEDISWN